jgi:putative ABC transport system permease protein
MGRRSVRPHSLPLAPGLLPRVILAELWLQRRNAVLMLLIVASVVAPVLLLLGLKTGVVTAFQQTLLRDPRTLEIDIVGARALSEDRLRALAADPRVGFVVARTRALNPTIDVAGPNGDLVSVVDLVTSGPGDPLLPPAAVQLPAGVAVWLSATLAEGLGVVPGQEVTGIVARKSGGPNSRAMLALTVAGVLDARAIGHRAMLVGLDLALAAERFRDGTLDVLRPAPVHGMAVAGMVAGARLYARGLRDVQPLARSLAEAGIETNTRQQRIAILLRLEQELAALLLIVAFSAGVGACLALMVLLWIDVEHKRRELAMLRLFGLSPRAVAAIPVAQALLLAFAGALTAGGLYVPAAALFDLILRRVAVETGFRCILTPGAYAMVLFAVLGLGLAAAAAAAWRAARVMPAEALRRR